MNENKIVTFEIDSNIHISYNNLSVTTVFQIFILDT